MEDIWESYHRIGHSKKKSVTSDLVVLDVDQHRRLGSRNPDAASKTQTRPDPTRWIGPAPNDPSGWESPLQGAHGIRKGQGRKMLGSRMGPGPSSD